MGVLWQDLRYGIRMLLRSPGFTIVAVLTLALGIGANTAIFTVVNAVLLKPLPYPNSDRLVFLTEHWAKFPILSVSYENYVDWRDQSHSYELVGASRATNLTLTGAGEPERLPSRMASATFFDLLGVRPVLGRTFLAEEDKAGGTPVAMISYGLWQRRFGSSPAILGTSITLDNQPYTVVGVLPADFSYQPPLDVFVPMGPWTTTLPDDRSWHPGIIPIARLKPGVSLEQARAELTTIAQRLEKQYPLYDTGVGANVNLMHEQLIQNARPALLILLAAVGLVLLIACANVANLLLARATGRGKEIAVRTALGAGRGRIVRQLLTESVLLALAGGVLAIIFAALGLASLLRLAGNSLPLATGVKINYDVLLFTAGLSLFTGIVFGLAPSLHAAKLDLRDVLNQTARGSSGGSHSVRLRSVLVVSEVALAMVLLVGAGLLIQSFLRLEAVKPGFNPEKLLVVDIPLSTRAYSTPQKQTQFYDELLSRLHAMPGVHSVGAASVLPITGGGGQIHFNIAGRPPKDPKEFILAGYRAISPGYFKTLEIPLLAGRSFTEADQANTQNVVMINAAMAKQFFPGVNPIGQKLQLGALPEKSFPYMDVIGVVGDVKQTLATDPISEMYIPYSQMPEIVAVTQVSVVLRGEGDPLALVGEFREAVQQINPDQPLVKIRTMEQGMSDTIAEPRFRTLLLGILAALALLISAIGVYGVVSYSVTQRTQEIGIRMALGAQLEDVLRMVLKEGLGLVLWGIAIGAVATYLASKVMVSFLFGVTASDPLTYSGVAILLALVALLACYIPARRAMRVDPMIALRYE